MTTRWDTLAALSYVCTVHVMRVQEHAEHGFWLLAYVVHAGLLLPILARVLTAGAR